MIWLALAAVVLLIWRFTMVGRHRGIIRVFIDLMLVMMAMGLVGKIVEWFNRR